MYAGNMLGDGAPSKPVEVNLRAFLGHLRSQEEGTRKAHAAQQEYHQRAAPSTGPAGVSSSRRRGDYLASATVPASAEGVADPAGNNGASSSPQPLEPAAEREAKQQQEGRVETSAQEAGGKDAQGSMPQPSASSPPAAFGGDFMGLGGFGEDLVDNLFAPPSSASRRRRRRPLHAPAAGGTLGARTLEGEGQTGPNGPYPLPPIVLVAGISGENRGVNATATAHKLGIDGDMQKDDERGAERDCEKTCRAVATAAGPGNLYGRGSSVHTTNNDVFHAFINLGRRLPGRLRR